MKIILVGHGHADHFGGSRYMQEHFGSKVYISAADWNLMENPPAGRAGAKKGLRSRCRGMTPKSKKESRLCSAT